jgi:hypothetical protein
VRRHSFPLARNDMAVYTTFPFEKDNHRFDGLTRTSGSLDTTSNVVIDPPARQTIVRETLDEMAPEKNANMAAFDSPTLGWFNTVGTDPFVGTTMGAVPNNEMVHSLDIPSKHPSAL